MEKWLKAGKIARETLEFAKKTVKEGALLIEVAEKIDKKILELGGKPAFPVNISLNHVAAHYTPFTGEKTAFGKDLVKIDIGVHVDGCIGDNACTIDLSGKNEDLVKASEEALNAAVKLIKPGARLGEIGKAIQDKIQGLGFSPIVNLSGHGLDEYTVHSGITIPNYDNGSDVKLEEGKPFAVEPFATTGSGKVIDGGPSNIYRLENKKPVRHPIARKILNYAEEEFKTLPFAKRWITEKFQGAEFGLRILEKERILHHYKQLIEKSKGLVSQAEHTVIVGKGVTTKA